MKLRTQVGGKYAGGSSVFTLRRRLIDLGLEVSHPIAPAIVATAGDVNYAFDPATTTFEVVELDYYVRIATCDFHAVGLHRADGSIAVGSSCGLEMAFAMSHGRAILADAQFTANDVSSPTYRPLITRNADLFVYVDEHISTATLEAAARRRPRYRWAEGERIQLQRDVTQLFRSLNVVAPEVGSL